MSSKRNPKVLSFGNKKEGFGRRIYHDPGFQFSPEFRDVFNTIPRETGLRESNLSINNSEKTIGNYFDNHFYNLNFTRRNFLKTAAITAVTGGLLSCEKDKHLEEIIDLPIPVITGPTVLTIPRVGMGVNGTFDSAVTKDAADLYWQLIKPLSMVENLEQKGNEPKVNINFAIPGNNEVKLIADNKGGRSRISHYVKINPPKLPDQNYDLPLLLEVRETKDQPVYGVYTLNTSTNEVTKIFSGHYYYDYINWEPSGQRMVFISDPIVEEVYPESPYKLTTYDFTKGTFKHISNNDSGKVWAPKWSPKGDWIAYLDDSKSYKYGVDVVALVRPDGSDQFYLDGAGQSLAFSAMGLSWDPEGKRLIAEGTPYYGLRLIIFDELFSGSPRILPTRLPTQEQIGRYYDIADESIKQGYSKDMFLKGANCNGGVAWSPDGQYVVFGFAFEYFRGMFLSRIDGTGDIEKIAGAVAMDDLPTEFWSLQWPTWSPDGSAIYFSAKNYDTRNLFKYDLSTKKYEQVMLPISGVEKVSLYG